MSVPTKPGNLERGWNDPPVFLHNVEHGAPPLSTPPKQRTLLNKRVAHTFIPSLPTGDIPDNEAKIENITSRPPPLYQPGVSDDTDIPGCGIVLFPPTSTTDVPKFVAPIIVPAMSPTEKDLPIVGSPTATNPITNTQVNVDNEQDMPNFDTDEQMYHYVMSTLQKTLKQVKTTLQPRTVDDVQRKLEILSNMWEAGSLSYPVKSGLARLGTALHKIDCDEAHKIHMALMMDSISEVGQWMVGVKRLIQEVRNNSKTLENSISTSATTSQNGNSNYNHVPILMLPTTLPPVQEPVVFLTSMQQDSNYSATPQIVQTDLEIEKSPEEHCDVNEVEMDVNAPQPDQNPKRDPEIEKS